MRAPKRIGILVNGGNYVGLDAAIRVVAHYQAVEPWGALGIYLGMQGGCDGR